MQKTKDKNIHRGQEPIVDRVPGCESTRRSLQPTDTRRGVGKPTRGESAAQVRGWEKTKKLPIREGKQTKVGTRAN